MGFKGGKRGPPSTPRPPVAREAGVIVSRDHAGLMAGFRAPVSLPETASPRPHGAFPFSHRTNGGLEPSKLSPALRTPVTCSRGRGGDGTQGHRGHKNYPNMVDGCGCQK